MPLCDKNKYVLSTKRTACILVITRWQGTRSIFMGIMITGRERSAGHNVVTTWPNSYQTGSTRQLCRIIYGPNQRPAHVTWESKITVDVLCGCRGEAQI